MHSTKLIVVRVQVLLALTPRAFNSESTFRPKLQTVPIIYRSNSPRQIAYGESQDEHDSANVSSMRKMIQSDGA